jgi:predicted small lipoprotein YifL
MVRSVRLSSPTLDPRSLKELIMKQLTSKILLLLSFALVSLSACGRKGALLPPEALVPASVRDLNVVQTGQDFRITWKAPEKEQGGRPLKDLSGFLLFRRDATPEGGDCPSCPDSWKLLSSIDLDMLATFQKSGDLFIYFDKGGEKGRRFQYRVTAFSKSGGRSSPADAPVKKLFQPPPAPTITATLQPGSIRIGFAPGKAADTAAIGFNIYRRTAGAAPPLLPFNKEPVTGTSWEDLSLEYGSSYRYTAAALSQIEGEIVESPHSEEIEILFRQLELR